MATCIYIIYIYLYSQLNLEGQNYLCIQLCSLLVLLRQTSEVAQNRSSTHTAQPTHVLAFLLVHHQRKNSLSDRLHSQKQSLHEMLCAELTTILTFIHLSSPTRILGSACVTIVRNADNRNGQLAVTFFVSFSGSVLDSDTAMTALQV